MADKDRAYLLHITVKGDTRWDMIEDDHVYQLNGSPFDQSATPLTKWKRARKVAHPDRLPLLAPVAPSKIVCVARNYPAHAAEHQAEIPQEPLLFFKPPSSVIGPGASIVLPPQSQQVEHEAELALVIGQRCRGVSPAEAWDYVLGVTCGNDVTARDLQQKDRLWTRAKGFDTFCPLGPWLVTGMSEEEASNLEVTCRVNGELRQRGRTGEMVFSPAQLIAYISSIMTLEPGDVIMTGTPAGVGPLLPGDVVEVEVEGVGALRNPVESGQAAP